eukprot:9036080-Prorocentrum_lima.AAC.1
MVSISAAPTGLYTGNGGSLAGGHRRNDDRSLSEIVPPHPLLGAPVPHAPHDCVDQPAEGARPPQLCR